MTTKTDRFTTKSTSIRRGLGIAFLWFSLVPLLLLGSILAGRSIKEQLHQAETLQSIVADEAIGKIHSYTHELESMLAMAARLLDLPELPPARRFLFFPRCAPLCAAITRPRPEALLKD